MDWKREAADKLRQYEARKSSLDRTAAEIHRLENDLTRIRSATTDSTPVRGGTCTREDAMVNNIALRGELDLARQDTARWLKIMDSALAELTDEERLILDRLFIHRQRGAADRLCQELGLQEVSSVYRRSTKALNHLTLALYGTLST